MKAQGDVNETYVEKDRGSIKKLFGIGKYDKRNFDQKRLKNLWDRQRLPIISPFISYMQDIRMQNLWRNYEINETGNRDIFRSMDRIKITFHVLQSSLNIYSLCKQQFQLVESFGPLHDFYELEKKNKLPLFEKIPEVVEYVENFGVIRDMVEFMRGFADEAEDRDFVDQSLTDKVGGALFYAESVNMDPIQNYFGEKVGLYFAFLQNFAIKLRWLGIFGIVVFVVDMIFLFKGNRLIDEEGQVYNIYIELYHYLRLVFTLIIVVWATLYTEFWKRKEQAFSIRFGQQNAIV